jgi:hypothetical protein
MKLGDKHFWLHSNSGLIVVGALSIIPTCLVAQLLGNTSDFMAVITGLVIANARMLAWKVWGDERKS